MFRWPTSSCGQSVRVETPTEIVLKKLFYRTELLKVRDVVDVAAVLERDPETESQQLKNNGLRL